MQPVLRKKRWLLVVLCAVLGSRWLLTDVLPGSVSNHWTQAAGALLCALYFGRVSPSSTFRPSRHTLPPALYSTGVALVLSGSALGQALFGRQIGTTSSLLALAMVPVFLAVTVAVSDQSGRTDLLLLLRFPLCGLAGLLLLLPQPSFRDGRSWATLLTLSLLPAVGAALVTESSPSTTPHSSTQPSRVLSIGALTASLIFVVLACHDRAPLLGSLTLVATILDTSIMALSLLALAHLGALVWSAQFLLLPLLEFLEGLVLLRPPWQVRSTLGLLLVAVGGIGLFLLQPDQPAAYGELGLQARP